jgi:hypothetical protein
MTRDAGFVVTCNKACSSKIDRAGGYDYARWGGLRVRSSVIPRASFRAYRLSICLK